MILTNRLQMLKLKLDISQLFIYIITQQYNYIIYFIFLEFNLQI